jgi:hypothetical protein
MARALAIFSVSLAAGAFLLWRALMPPAPLALPEQGLVLANVTVVQPGEARLPERRVRIEGNRIVEIAPASGAAEDAEFVGAYALPGLIDMHVHFPPDAGLRQEEIFAFLFLRHGVTSVRDAGDPDGTSSQPVRSGVREGRYPGPRSFACGPFLDHGEQRWPNSLMVGTPAEAAAAVERVADAGWDCLKVYDGLSSEVLAAIHTAADRRGLPVIGHVPRGVPFEQARLDDVQHLTGVPAVNGRTDPFPKVLEAWRRFDEARAAMIEQVSLREGIAHTPTFVTLDRGMAYEADYEALRRGPDAALLPRFYADVVWSPTQGLPFLRDRDPEDHGLMEDAYLRGTALVRRLHRAGVVIHAGTDTQIAFIVPGAALHRELRILADAAGLGPEAALAAATTVPGRSLPVAKLGRLEPGAPADLVLYRADPTRDLAALDDLLGVVADGRLYRRAELDAQLDRYRAYYRSAVFDRLSTWLVRRVMAQMFADQDSAAEAGSE